MTVLYVYLDGFKAVNDRLGHGAGDSILAESAERLRSCVRRGDVVARLGGDEFAVLAGGIGRAEAEELAGRIVARLAEPVRVGKASVGVAMGEPGRDWSIGALPRPTGRCTWPSSRVAPLTASSPDQRTRPIHLTAWKGVSRESALARSYHTGV